ncbi:MAG TPA: chromosomal replication initiator protein DnaA [Acidimicrobiales bacterium]|nr:chromosomal replication initiator protein DnaA [Acidimicrobiales bacterium]
MTDLADLWATCSANLRKQVPEPTWNTWLAPLVLLEAKGTRFVIAAPNSLVRERVTARFQTLIEESLADGSGNVSTDVEIVVKALPPEALFTTEDELAYEKAETQLSQPDEPEEPPPALPADPQHVGSDQGRPPANASHSNRRAQSMLNPRYTFEAFVIGASNRFAHAAAQRVAEEPAKAYNPLFIYGASGLGKTHILHAIGNYDNQIFPNLCVCYVSTETFLNEFIDSIRTKGQTAFKRRYRAYDVLLVDDIQLLEGKKETQEEFFYTFNSFYEAEKQIVISSDRHPRSIATLEDRLRSRFESGLITDIQPPELETRLAILRKKQEGEEVVVPEEVLELIATNIKDNIRELEGALIRLSAYASIHDVPITVQLAENVLADVIDDNASRSVTPDQIFEATARAFDLTIEQIRGPSRRRPLVSARQTAMYLFRELTDYSYPAIASEFGGRDHTTVMHAQRKVAKLMKEKRQVYEQVTDLMHKIKSGE